MCSRSLSLCVCVSASVCVCVCLQTNVHICVSVYTQTQTKIYIEKKHNYPVIPEISGHYHDEDYNNIPLNKTNPTIAVFNNLYNFNPTHREMSYYHPHETDKLFHHNISRPRFEKEILRDTSIPDEINEIKKDNAVDAHKLPEHSFTIKRRART